MAQVPQPGVLASVLRSFASFDAEHGWGVNLFVVIALLSIGACLLTGERRLVRVGVVAGVVVCLANWVLVQDLGFFGGVGTDPNSMLPTSLPARDWLPRDGRPRTRRGAGARAP